MLCPVIVVSYEVTQKGGTNKLETRYFPRLPQAEFYYNTKLEHLKKTYQYILGRIEENNTASNDHKTGFPWQNYTGAYSDGKDGEQIAKWWVLSNPLAGTTYTLRLTNTSIELDGPEYCRLEEIICNLVDYVYETVGDTNEANGILRDCIGLDDYEMDLFAIPEIDTGDAEPDPDDTPDPTTDEEDDTNLYAG